MPVIELETEIRSDIETCFDLARSIDLHKISTLNTKEEAIDGRTSGLIGLNEFVTWKARHFGITQMLTSKITAFEKPFHFRDEQLEGVFKYIIHDHHFEKQTDKVLMKDVFKFQSPYGYLGKFFNTIILTKYLTKLLVERNRIIKEYAETGKGRALLNGSGEN